MNSSLRDFFKQGMCMHTCCFSGISVLSTKTEGVEENVRQFIKYYELILQPVSSQEWILAFSL